MAPLPTTSAPFRHKRWLLAALLAAVLIAALVVLFHVLLGDAGGGPSPLANVDPDSGNPLHVEIRVPSAGARLSAADPTVVFVQSFGGGVVVRFELWVDGKLTRYQLSPESDPTLPASGRLQWLPDAPGPHVLVARALDAEGRMGRSRPVVVEAAADPDEGLVPVTVNLQPGNTVESIAQALGTTPDMVRRADPASEPQPGDDVVVFLPPEKVPEGYVDDDALPAEAGAPPAPGPEGEPEGGAPPAEAVVTPTAAPSPDEGPAQPADGDAPDPLPWGFRRLDDPEPPTAPEGLSASLGEGCEVRLEWTDTSDSETGFRVYRFGGGGDFRLIGDLEANVLTYTDRVTLGGHYEYYVTGVNAGGESDSNLAGVDVPDEECSMSAPLLAAEAMWTLQFEWTSLATNTQYDDAYCYLSLARLEPYARVPDNENLFLAPTAGGGWNIEHYAAGINRRVFGQPPREPVPVRIECWARRGGEEPELLGSFSAEHPSEEWDGRDLFGATDGFRVVYHIEPYENLGRAQFSLTDASIPAPSNVERPGDADECANYTRREGGQELSPGDTAAGLFACLFYNYLVVWEWWPSEAYPRSEIDGFRVYYNIYAWYNDQPDQLPAQTWEVLGEVGSVNQLFPVPAVPRCGIYAFRVTALILAEDGLEERESLPSRPLVVEGPPCSPSTVEITLDRLDVGLIDDGVTFECAEGIFAWICVPAPDFQAEAYGFGGFRIYHEDGSGVGVAYLLFWTHDCGGQGEVIPPIPVLGVACVDFHPRRVTSNRDIYFEGENLATCDPTASPRCTDYGPNHNTFRLLVGEGDTIEFMFNLRDDDPGVDDTWCGTDEDYSSMSEIDESKPIFIGPYSRDDGFGDRYENLERTGGTGFHGHYEWDNSGDALSDQDAPCELEIDVSVVDRPPYVGEE